MAEMATQRYIWAKDDVVMWDNRRTMHSVEPFEPLSTLGARTLA